MNYNYYSKKKHSIDNSWNIAMLIRRNRLRQIDYRRVCRLTVSKGTSKFTTILDKFNGL